MIPSGYTDNDIAFEEITQPSHTYNMDLSKDKINGYVDGIKAVEQSIYLMINIERYDYSIYSWNYGIELADLFGMPQSFVYSELERRFTEALLQDDRIISIEDFEIESKRGDVMVSFTAVTIFGPVQAERTVIGLV